MGQAFYAQFINQKVNTKSYITVLLKCLDLNLLVKKTNLVNQSCDCKGQSGKANIF